MPSHDPTEAHARERDLRSTLARRQILDGARAMFLMNGFAGASVDQIAAQAGVSKTSLYRHFKSKDALFDELIATEAERIAAALPLIDMADLEPAGALRAIGIAILETLSNPATIVTLRLVIGALGRLPQLGDEFRRRALGPTVEHIAAYVDARAAGCAVRIGDGRAAAEDFTRRCLAHVMESVLDPDRRHLTEAECLATVDDILRNCSIRWRQDRCPGAADRQPADKDRA